MMGAALFPVGAFFRLMGIGPGLGRDKSESKQMGGGGMDKIAMTDSRKGPGKGGYVKPEPDLPPHPDPARRLPDTTEHKNGYTPKPTLQ